VPGSPSEPARGVPTPGAVASTGPARLHAAAQVFVADPERPLVAEEDVAHLLRVLRLRAGEPVVVADGAGRYRLTRVTGSAEGDAVLEPDGPVLEDPAPSRPVTVAFVPVKGDRPEWVVQKLTELGVDRIAVLRSGRSVVRWEGEREERSLGRLRRVAREAAAQSRRARVPAVEGVWSLAAAVDALRPEVLRLAHPGGAPLDGAVSAVAVGPEGGWDEDELAGAGPPVGLGAGILRAETAAVAVGTLLCAIRDGVLRAP